MDTGIGDVTSATGGGDGNGDVETGDVMFDPLSAFAGALLTLVSATVAFDCVGGETLVTLRPVAFPACAGGCTAVTFCPAVASKLVALIAGPGGCGLVTFVRAVRLPNRVTFDAVTFDLGTGNGMLSTSTSTSSIASGAGEDWG
jgi:hypothetical protein